MNETTVMVLYTLIVLALLIGSMGLHLHNMAKRRAAAKEGLRLLGEKCSACGGKLTPGDVHTSALRIFDFRSGGKIRVIGAARCEQCGQVMFFA